jgi:hypothetical protein
MAIAKLSIDIEARLAKFEKQLDSVSKSTEKMAGKVKSHFSDLGKEMGASLAAFITIGAFKQIVDNIDRVGEAAERIGMTAESLSALAYAGKMTGAEFDDVTTALTKLSSKMQDAAAGNKSAVDLFRDIGVSVKDASGNLKSSDQVLAEVADRFAKFEDGAAKTALAVDLFGKSGAKLVPLLNSGAQGIADMRTEAEKLGGVISNDLAKQAAEFNDNIDRLGTVAASAGRSIANDFLPSLNKLAEEFIAAKKAGMGFWESVFNIGTTDPTKTAGEQIARLNKEIGQWQSAIGDRRKQSFTGLDDEKIKNEIASLTKLREYFKQIQLSEISLDNYGNEGRGLVGASGKQQITRAADSSGKAGKVASPEATAEAKAYGDAMDALAKSVQTADMAMLDLSGSQKQIYELMTSPAWASMPDTWKQTAAAQFEQAYAAEQAAAATAQLNRLLGATESSKIEEARDDMLALVEALEQGVISEEKYLEAVAARLGKGTQEIEKQKSLAEELGLTFTSAFEDAIAGGKGFSDVLKGLESDILRLLTRMAVTEPLGNSVKGIDWGGIVKSVAGWFGGATANANGNVYSSPSLSAYSGGVYSTPKFFAFANGAGVFGEAGPEAIMPLKRGKDGKLGVTTEGMGGGVTVNVINNTDAQARTEKRSDGRGGSIIDVVIERTKAAIASDIGSGSGAVPAAIQSTYGVKRTAGAY